MELFMQGDRKDSAATTTKLDGFLTGWSKHQQNQQGGNQNYLLICRERSSTLAIWQALETVHSSNKENNDKSQGVAETTASEAAVLFLIGPEGGWSPAEEALLDDLEARFPDFVFNISLGPTVLRAETAAMTAMAAFALSKDFHRISNSSQNKL
jgi:RsmE family RNA methyltransferase